MLGACRQPLIDYTVISIARKLHNVSWLAVQGIADCVQRAEAYGAYFTCFYFGKIYI